MTKIFDMEQCHRFLHSWQNTCRTGPLEDEVLAWTPHASKQLEIISLFHINDISVHSFDPKFTHLATRYQHALFSEEHVISGSHPDNLVCG